MILLLSYLHSSISYTEGILPKGPYLPCVSMAGMAFLAGYHPYIDNSYWNSQYPSFYVALNSGYVIWPELQTDGAIKWDVQ